MKTTESLHKCDSSADFSLRQMLSVSWRRALLAPKGSSSGHWFQLHLCATPNCDECVKADIPIASQSKLPQRSTCRAPAWWVFPYKERNSVYLKQYSISFPDGQINKPVGVSISLWQQRITATLSAVKTEKHKKMSFISRSWFLHLTTQVSSLSAPAVRFCPNMPSELQKPPFNQS